MKSRLIRPGQWTNILYVGLAGLVYFFLAWQVITEAATPDPSPPAWSSPTTKAIKRVSEVTGAQSSPVSQDNIDCYLLTYRQTGSSTMRTGCFMPTAFGMYDSDNGVGIFNGSDEGLPLVPYSNQSLLPWPQTLILAAITPAGSGGGYVGLYTNALSDLRDNRNLFGQLTSKKLTGPPSLFLRDKLGQQLVINPLSLAFSDGGSWLVAETLNRSFVRINLGSLELKAFAGSYSNQTVPGLSYSQVAISGNGRYSAIYNKVAGSFNVYDLTTCQGTPANLQPENCQSYDYLGFIKSQIPGLQSIKHVRFVNDGLISFEAYTDNPTNNGIYEIAPTAGIYSLIDYLGLGDSYTSGEGAHNYLAGTDTQNNQCHLSVHSYPVLLTNDLFTARGGHSVACSGARIKDVASPSDSYRGQVRDVLDFKRLKDENSALLNSVMTNFMPGYVAQQRFVGYYQPAALTVSVGGNDIGFGNILQECVMPKVSRHLSDNDCFNTYEDRLEVMQLIDRTKSRWTALFKQLRAQSPHSRVYSIGYPQIAVDDGNCARNVNLSKSEITFSIELINYLNQAIKSSTSSAGLTYVDIGQALKGHRLCETASHNVAVNGLTSGKDAGPLGLKVLGRESYHPNALGHRLIEQAILSQTSNLTKVTSTASANFPSKLLEAPKSNRTTASRIPADNIITSVAKKGQSIDLKINDYELGLRPNTAYSVRLSGISGTSLTTVVTNSATEVTATLTIPTSAASGSHTINIVGEGNSGSLINVTQPIYIAATDNDTDGDGIINSSDSCPAAINSGVNTDQDGIDDICDNLISQPPTPSVGSSSNTVGSTSLTSNPPAAPPSETQLLQPTSQAYVNLSSWQLNSSLKSVARKPAISRLTDAGLDRTTASLSTINPGRTLRTSVKLHDWLGWLILIWLLLILLGLLIEIMLNARRQRSNKQIYYPVGA